MALTYNIAHTIAHAAIAEAGKRDLKICVAIVDNHGNLVQFHRMDGTSHGSIQVSQQKAYTSSAFPLSTRKLAEQNAGLPGGPYGGGAISKFVLLAGGLPIFDQEGQHIGAVGISGATPDLDELCAQASIDVIAQTD